MALINYAETITSGDTFSFFFFFLTIHPEKVITVWLFKKPLSPWPMDELSSENHWFKLFCNDNHDNTIKQFEVFLVWLDRGVETISFATEGFLPWGCLRNWDSIPVCVLRFLVIDPKPLKVEYIRVFRHTMLNTHWSQSHGKSHSIQFSAKAGFSTLITPVECHFTWACRLSSVLLNISSCTYDLVGWPRALCAARMWNYRWAVMSSLWKQSSGFLLPNVALYSF